MDEVGEVGRVPISSAEGEGYGDVGGDAPIGHAAGIDCSSRLGYGVAVGVVIAVVHEGVVERTIGADDLDHASSIGVLVLDQEIHRARREIDLQIWGDGTLEIDVVVRGIRQELRGTRVPDKGVSGAVVGTGHSVSVAVVGVEGGGGRG